MLSCGQMLHCELTDRIMVLLHSDCQGQHDCPLGKQNLEKQHNPTQGAKTYVLRYWEPLKHPKAPHMQTCHSPADVQQPLQHLHMAYD